MPSADFCPAVRPPFDSLSRRSDTEQISWGKLNCLPCTAARCTLRILDGYGLRGNLPARPMLAPYIRFVHRLARLLYASFRPRLAAIALAFSLALHLHQVGQGTLTPKPLSMPSTQVSRWRGGRFACPRGRALALRLVSIASRVDWVYDHPRGLQTVLHARSNPFRNTVRKYQNSIQFPYVPRPPQSPAASLKRLYRK
jgi:hypothetical protein